jgi:hypothetical protein
MTTCGMDPEPSRTRGFAKSPVYTGGFGERTTKGTQVAQMPSPSRNGLLHAGFGESGAIAAGSIEIRPPGGPYLTHALWLTLQMPRTPRHRKSASRGLISEKELQRALR